MDSIIKKFRVKEGEKVSLSKYDPSGFIPRMKEDAEGILAGLKERMNTLQEQFYAAGQHSLLLIFQAMDAAGKDSAIKHVMSGLNPQGCQVFSFKQPSAEEAAHDFLWRHYKALPALGHIGIHNRSHYENVLVCKVHPSLLGGDADPDEKFWKHRYESIADFEKHLARNGTILLKFFLNVSKDEQKERFLERLSDDSKNWKFSAGDLEERKLWNDYMKAYEAAIGATSTDASPWYIIPADRKWFTRIAIATVIVNTLESFSMHPAQEPLTDKQKKEFGELLSNE